MQFRTAIAGFLALLVAALLLASAKLANDMAPPAAPATPAAVSAPAADPAKTANVITISNFTFAPNNLSAPAGTTVTWTNNDDTIHRVMITDLKVKSNALDTGDSFSYKFDKPGTYKYFCTMHPVMTGVVVVGAAQ